MLRIPIENYSDEELEFWLHYNRVPIDTLRKLIDESYKRQVERYARTKKF